MHNQSLPTAYFYVSVDKGTGKGTACSVTSYRNYCSYLVPPFFSECAAIGLQLLENPASLHWQPDEDVSTGQSVPDYP